MLNNAVNVNLTSSLLEAYQGRLLPTVFFFTLAPLQATQTAEKTMPLWFIQRTEAALKAFRQKTTCGGVHVQCHLKEVQNIYRM